MVKTPSEQKLLNKQRFCESIMNFKRYLLAISLFVFSTFYTYAFGCYDKLLSADTVTDSSSFYVHMDEIDFDDRDDNLSYAVKAINVQLKKLDCEKKDIELDLTQSKCAEIFPGELASKVCYVHARSGYFHVANDYVDGTRINFYRWD